MNEVSRLAGKRIAETLELLEQCGTSKKEIDIIRKAFWRFYDEIILNKKVSEYERETNR